MKLYLIRHGQTEWNTQRRVQGAMDSPLTKNGIIQAENAARRLKDIHFAAAFASPQLRAYRTAEIITADHPYLKLEKQPEKWDVYKKTPSAFTAPNGDCMIARVAESKAFADRLVERYFGENVLCVTHGYAIRIFLAAVLGIPLESTRFFMSGNTAISIVEYKQPDTPQVRVFGDVSHNQ